MKLFFIADETIIVVTSDNGGDYDGAVGDLRGRKGETWEGGMRVPQFIAWPGVTKPVTTIDAMTMNIDLFPSLLAMRGIPLPSDRIIDGRDIRSMLSGATPSPHQYLYYLTTWTAEVSAVRNAKYKYREPVDDTSPLGGAGKALHPAPALYDLEKDNEAHNVINRHPEVTEDLKRQIAALRAEIENNRRGWKM
ncbi:sulfatase-like hydrolase/transferase [Novosphingobium sp. SL115]|uniref:sulfatase/phosphatase domain-containing protein n=1 Tax=Novosphingobium sp. SL115 TaxID=2995150 RepID=UPI002273E3A6|nr:sulfatase/phosphatase domain-containing protein [Novosphingobium sp. SL115]MCY1670997.1 sulfatase-like hydrolase/transferase [Novosphingobium sp. SL115]